MRIETKEKACKLNVLQAFVALCKRLCGLDGTTIEPLVPFLTLLSDLQGLNPPNNHPSLTGFDSSTNILKSSFNPSAKKKRGLRP